MAVINRWLHPPKLYVPSHGVEHKAGWLELFYDLIYVAAFIQLGDALSAHYAEMKALAFLIFAGLFAPLWLTWTSFTFFSNRFVVDDFLHRALVFGQMFGIAGMAVNVGGVFEGDPRRFVLCLVLARAVLVAFYARSYRAESRARELSRRNLITFGIGALIWLISAFTPAPWGYGLWAVALLVDFSAGLSRQSRALSGRYPPDAEHMTERYGLLTIIVLGEAFVKVLSAVAAEGMSGQYVLMSVLALAITFSLWWIYFDDIAHSRIKGSALAPYIWVYTHLPLTLGMVGVGVAIKKAVIELDPFDTQGAKYRILLCGTLGLVLVATAVIDLVTARAHAEMSDRARTAVRFTSGVFVLLLAPVGALMPGWVFVALVAATCVAQVIIDLYMAPETLEPGHHHHHALFSEVHHHDHEHEDEAPRPVTVRPALGNAVRIGTPDELRRDFYFQLMEGSWTQLFGFLVGAYLFTNLVFGALYLLEPGSVQGLNPESYFEAFSFSVQTLSTIGYGAMSPGTTYGHAVMVIEAAVGLLGVAFATGLLFAKASRPRASALFSRPVVVNVRDGRPTLTFRVGNARGNEIVEASLRVAVLVDAVSPEGHKMRRLHDLPLVRDMTPVFTLSWTVMHVIDERSPLYGLTAENAGERIFSIVATMTGHDSTYAQTVHARTLYYADDLQFDRRFVDVISSTADGRILIDYSHFHETVPVDEGAPRVSWGEE